MFADPIVAETRALREELMRDVGGDLDGLFGYLRKREALHRERLVNFQVKRPAQNPVDHKQEP
jgi:hypothetical protein